MFYLTLEDQLIIGQATQLGSPSTQHDYLSVMFEDDGETGYFYALDTRQTTMPIVDALHIYNTSAINEKEMARKLQICWSEDGCFALLLINDYPHAAFDFVKLIAYNHSKFPEPEFGSMWSRREITDELVQQWLNA
ncbi:DUF2251 domain-containing protein [Testudinibacter sp. TR-2022]|uniref:DUF2251 domain-containing protein n=1 Tax=Testudinibacter sp. TR-2022 TaxID=2585029 RepID=UPI001118F335|nr:DUF2251 domain-containing protein [Testudinibacter sp. TR-2022]TNH03832.1 DUF2251 domain-containing protein [Pasteurellaceae bacterium Phil31]TNH11579.1 DUF2251 domain-containing protein [Testudinibacter sp. TR-2022]TNH11775.1 DUF2251 domain-containing protein [Testudinibacter sp. TR-2022]TNH14930.1 DUF2251 domain-containing protein [Testudinibacter sp. TR-2022]TNH20379.1 DUF2251 domain-containing protein [Testudinibacter sp. TR-2022]